MNAIQPYMPIGKATLLAVSKLTGFSVDELKGEGRNQPLVHARWAVAYLLRKRGWTARRIGILLGNRDHTTILHALNRCTYRKDVMALVEAVSGAMTADLPARVV